MVRNEIVEKFFSINDKNKNAEIEKQVAGGPAEFETAVSAIGFGKFNYLLFLIMIPSQWSIDTCLMSYISPIAQCDLDICLNDRGMLNAITPIGSITTGIFWGVLIDTFGRRRLILYGLLVLGVVTIITSFSQNYIFLLTLKFTSGGLVGGIYIAQCTYYAEFHSMEYRSKMQLATSFIHGAGLVVLPLVSAFVLPLSFNVTLFNGYLVFHSWNLMILATSALQFIAAISHIFLPESPKYLMTKGNGKEALAVFSKVYEINTGKPRESYPIEKLVSEKKETDYVKKGDKCSVANYVKNGYHQITPLFSKEYLPKLMLITAIQFLTIVSLNTTRLWLPQIFQAIHEHQAKHNGMTSQLCTMLNTLSTATNASSTSEPVCNVTTENSLSVYLNSMINALMCIICYALDRSLIWLGGKTTIIILGALGTISSISILTTYLSQNNATTLALTALHLASVGITFDVMMSVIVVIFPTALRATAISTSLLIGRFGGMAENILFPILLEKGCAAPFLTLGGVAMATTFLYLFLPKTDNKSLK